MFCKLALRNVRRSFRDYGVYLLTLTFGVCLPSSKHTKRPPGRAAALFHKFPLWWDRRSGGCRAAGFVSRPTAFRTAR